MKNPRYATGLQRKVENNRCLGFDCSLKVRNSNFIYEPSVVNQAKAVALPAMP